MRLAGTTTMNIGGTSQTVVLPFQHPFGSRRADARSGEMPPGSDPMLDAFWEAKEDPYNRQREGFLALIPRTPRRIGILRHMDGAGEEITGSRELRRAYGRDLLLETLYVTTTTRQQHGNT